MKTSLPFKQPQGSDGESFARISVIPFKEVDDDNNQSQGNDNDVNLMILGQGPAITTDTGSESEQLSKAHQYQWGNDSPWVTEAQNALLSQDPQALSNIRWDYTTILVMILKEAKVQAILCVEPAYPMTKASMPCWN